MFVIYSLFRQGPAHLGCAQLRSFALGLERRALRQSRHVVGPRRDACLRRATSLRSGRANACALRRASRREPNRRHEVANRPERRRRGCPRAILVARTEQESHCVVLLPRLSLLAFVAFPHPRGFPLLAPQLAPVPAKSWLRVGDALRKLCCDLRLGSTIERAIVSDPRVVVSGPVCRGDRLSLVGCSVGLVEGRSPAPEEVQRLGGLRAGLGCVGEHDETVVG
jgi:hypothetical protein